MRSVVDVPALMIALLVALGITAALLWAHRGEDHRRGWLTAAGLVAVLGGIGVLDLLRSSPRETPLVTAVFGAALPVLGALGMIRGTRRVRARFRWPIVFLTAFVLLFAGLLIGATVVGRLLG